MASPLSFCRRSTSPLGDGQTLQNKTLNNTKISRLASFRIIGERIFSIEPRISGRDRKLLDKLSILVEADGGIDAASARRIRQTVTRDNGTRR